MPVEVKVSTGTFSSTSHQVPTIDDVNKLAKKITDRLDSIQQGLDGYQEKFYDVDNRFAESAKSIATYVEDAVAGSQRTLSNTIDTRLEEMSAQLRKYQSELTVLSGETRKIDSLNGSVEQLGKTLEAIRVGIKKIDDELGGETFTKLKTLDVEALKKNLEESVSDRNDYKELWAAQKLESQAIDLLAKNRGNPVFQALIAQKGLEVQVGRKDLQQLAVSEAQLMSALVEYPDDVPGDYKRMIANLAYAYVLMAQHYKVARAHVTAVVDDKTVAELLVDAGVAGLKAAISAGLSAVTLGIAGIVMPVVLDIIKSATSSATPTGTPTTQDLIAEGIQQDKLKTSVKSAMGGASEGLVALSGLTPAGGELTDPFDFFMDQEAKLRRLAAELSSSTDRAALGRRTVQLDRLYTLEELAQDRNWQFLFKVHSDLEEYGKNWSRVSELLAVNMRRLCWRMYCRSQWNNRLFSYSLSVVAEEAAEKLGHSLDGPASEWHYKVWDSVKIMPRHWEKICADFRGPEHNVSGSLSRGMLRADARVLIERNAWISMAAVQCCQIRRPLDDRFIDLEKRSRLGGAESEPLKIPSGLTDRDLVFGNSAKIRELGAFLTRIDAAGGTEVGITEIRFGRGATGRLNRWTKASGKKGTLTGSNSPTAGLIDIPRGAKITVMVGRRNTSGEAGLKGGFDARVGVYVAGKGFHDGAKDCDLVSSEQLCWYCKHTSAEDKKLESFKLTRRLKRVDSGNVGTSYVSMEGWNYCNFPDPEKTYANEAGLYCIRLDPRPELMTFEGSGGVLQRHVSDEWWFKIDAGLAIDKAPNKPTITWAQQDPRVGAEKIKGTYAGDFDTATTQIHVWVSGKQYGPKAVKPEGNTTVDWEIEGIPALKRGQWVMATATWEDQSASDEVQTESDKHWVKPGSLTITEPVSVGDYRIRGHCDSAPGIYIQLGLEKYWQTSHKSVQWQTQTVRLEGAPDLQDAHSRPSWEISLNTPIDTSVTGIQVQAVAEPGHQASLIASSVAALGPPPPPDIFDPIAFTKKIAGTCIFLPAEDRNAFVFVKVEGKDKVKATFDAARVGQEHRNWQVEADAELQPGLEVTAWIELTGRENRVIKSADASASVTIPPLPVPVVDPLSVVPARISGKVSEFPGTEVRVFVEGKELLTPATVKYTETGTGEWELRDFTLKEGAETSAPTKASFEAGTKVQALTKLKRAVTSGKGESELSEAVNVMKLPKPAVDPQLVAGHRSFSGRVALSPHVEDEKSLKSLLEGTMVQVLVNGTPSRNAGKLELSPGKDRLLPWGMTLPDVLEPGQKITAKLVRGDKLSDESEAVTVKMPAKPEVLPLIEGYDFIAGLAKDAAYGTVVKLFVEGEEISLGTDLKVNSINEWSCFVQYYAASLKPEKDKKITAKLVVGDKETDASDPVTVTGLPKPVINLPLAWSSSISGQMVGDVKPGSGTRVKISLRRPENQNSQEETIVVTGADYGTWTKTGLPPLLPGTSMKGQTLRRDQTSGESEVIEIPLREAPTIDQPKAGATVVTGTAIKEHGAKVKLTFTDTNSVQHTAYYRGHLDSDGHDGTVQPWKWPDVSVLRSGWSGVAASSCQSGWKIKAELVVDVEGDRYVVISDAAEITI